MDDAKARETNENGAAAAIDSTPRTAEPAALDQAKVETLIRDVRARQNLGLGIVGGVAAAIVGAVIWATITVLSEVQIGWMAVGVGFLVGSAVRLLGKGIDKPFGYAGAAISLFGCLLGNVLTICGFVANKEGVPLSAVLLHINFAAIPEAMAATFQPMDLLFYGIAIYEGYRFSFRRITPAEVARVASMPVAGSDRVN
jgi:hypothetical protein